MACVLLTLAALAGCRQRDSEALSRTGRAVGDKLAGLAGGADGKAALAVGAVRGAVGHTAIDGRVRARLRWERDLADQPVCVKLGQPGVVVLHGRVADAKQKARALALARRTLGVEKVVDELEVRPDEDE
jgi:osmotically-inducible protein OsmY